MGYFPFFMEMEGTKGVVVGGGRIALRKVEKLLPFRPLLTVIAPEIEDAFFDLQKKAREEGGAALTLLRRKAVEKDLEGADFVIAATAEESVNAWVSGYCRERRILVNAVDDKEKCTFLFPALVKDGSLTVGISTDGNCPAAAAYMRAEIEKALPEGIGSAVEMAGRLREEGKELWKEPAERADMQKRVFFRCLLRKGKASLQELRALLRDGGDGDIGRV